MITPEQAAGLSEILLTLDRAGRAQEAATASCRAILLKPEQERTEWDKARFRQSAYLLGILVGLSTVETERRLRAGEPLGPSDRPAVDDNPRPSRSDREN